MFELAEKTNQSQLSTSTAAKFFLALGALSPPTVSDVLACVDHPTRAIHKTTSRQLPADAATYGSLMTSVASTPLLIEESETDRPTTDREQLMGELRSYHLMSDNWDGEGAAAPITNSVKDAVAFVGLLGNELLPEAMLNASGRAGLFWKTDRLYADLEFLGDGRVSYYVERDSDKHKGVINFDAQTMPPLFPILLRG